ncbi:unnamed protein product [Lymnaea stagnalis]|uniref:Carbonyl reductase n=1 Tax=Lymnaea stagnalis TaxID=6523 RepID=A0AAV2HEZ7_LYMST
MDTKVAVVTGSNKGVGFAIVRALCRQFDGDVYLTESSKTSKHICCKGMTAITFDKTSPQIDVGRGYLDLIALETRAEGRPPANNGEGKVCTRNDHESVVRLRDFLKKTYGGLDILVNNAGIVFNDDSIPFVEQVAATTRTNFFSTLEACQVLFPILRPHSRVVNLSSMSSQMGLARCSEALRARFTDSNLTMDELRALVNKFVETAKVNKHLEAGFCGSSYFLSKIGVTVMSMIQQREIDSQGANDIVVNACCPGYVATDLTNHQGSLTIDEGAATPVYCALLPPNINSPRGKFIREKKIADWKM